MSTDHSSYVRQGGFCGILCSLPFQYVIGMFVVVLKKSDKLKTYYFLNRGNTLWLFKAGDLNV